jgi:hypothetical protein
MSMTKTLNGIFMLLYLFMYKIIYSLELHTSPYFNYNIINYQARPIKDLPMTPCLLVVVIQITSLNRLFEVFLGLVLDSTFV